MSALETIGIFKKMAKEFEQLSKTSFVREIQKEDTNFLQHKRNKLTTKIRTISNEEEKRRRNRQSKYMFNANKDNDNDSDEDKKTLRIKKEPFVSVSKSSNEKDNEVEDMTKAFNTLVNESEEEGEILFVPQQGWEVNLNICELHIEIGPFFSRIKAKKVSCYLKDNKHMISQMDLEERQRWINSLSELLNFIMIA